MFLLSFPVTSSIFQHDPIYFYMPLPPSFTILGAYRS